MRTKADRNRDRPRPPRTPLDPELIAPARSTLLACIAGARANNNVASTQTPALTARTRQSIWPGRLTMMPGACAGNASTNAFRHQCATTIPPAVAKAERIRPSVRSCCNKRRRPAPSARRVVICGCRINDLTKSSVLTFAHAIRRTNRTTANAICSVGNISVATLKGLRHSGRSWIS